MGDRRSKDALYDAFGEIAKALASGRRAELLDVLAQGERHVEELAAQVGQSVANTSFHLRTLAAVGLVSTRREGTRIHYRLASERVEDLWRAVRDVAVAHHGALDRLAGAYLGDVADVERIGRAELSRRLISGEVIVVDVRPEAEYLAGHLPGAVSVAPDALEDRLANLVADLPDEVEIVTYCRGPFCVFADDAARWLRDHGRRARRLEDGFPEWRRAGGNVEVRPAA